MDDLFALHVICGQPRRLVEVALVDWSVSVEPVLAQLLLDVVHLAAGELGATPIIACFALADVAAVS